MTKPEIGYVDDVGGDLLDIPHDQLQRQADAQFKKGNKQAILNKLKAMNALARIIKGQCVNHFWKPPFGEPEWVTIPAGEFWMGERETLHKVILPEYQISRVLVTNAQYALYIKDSGAKPPENWRGGPIPAGLENHPVVRVTWYDALNYCKWLGEKINQAVSLPSEAEWEKAARGDKDKREYPWGEWADLHCNSDELGLNETTPVGLFLNGASPYGVLDLSGNVWEWTRSLYKEYPYVSEGREVVEAKRDDVLVRRGGSFLNTSGFVRCAVRDGFDPNFRSLNIGFRLVVSPNASLKL